MKHLTEKNRQTLKLTGYWDTGLNVSQLARAIGCDRKTVYYWQDKGYAEHTV